MSLIELDQHHDYSKELTIFTDGSALSNSKTSPAGWGVYIPLMKKSLSKGIIGTNNQAELEAMRVALWYFKTKFDEIFKNIVDKVETKNTVFIISDSEYTLKAITGINKVNANKSTIETCKAMINEIQNELNIHIYFIHVNSHTGGTDFMSVNNAIVDKLARDKAESMKIDPGTSNDVRKGHFTIY